MHVCYQEIEMVLLLSEVIIKVHGDPIVRKGIGCIL